MVMQVGWLPGANHAWCPSQGYHGSQWPGKHLPGGNHGWLPYNMCHALCVMYYVSGTHEGNLGNTDCIRSMIRVLISLKSPIMYSLSQLDDWLKV